MMLPFSRAFCALLVLPFTVTSLAAESPPTPPKPTTQNVAKCAKRDVVLDRLGKLYGETRQSIGLGSNNGVIETFASTTGSWTIIVTTPAGMSCVVASGRAFEHMAEPAGQDA
ncbi:hypothetical protein AQS8620_02787 [Aquimixticola soesokkakensis]|uniref:Uncharacterized protein n=1 Tax=Aquimixticola soesokkakensis TaxID=1519096 RepID=A0A1Y5TG72_9RHOB|nr:hypothetical protein [Aquimixticola soesokkakensis]SLN61161.1 hypothetical protein AQS8620_02787 [Aquimixticola soesokkakensis]